MKAKTITLFLLIALMSTPALAADIRFDTNDIEKWDSIYLGNYNQNPIEWLVLDAKENSMGGSGMFLITRNGLYMTPISSAKYYPSSGLIGACENLFDSFDMPEQDIVLSTHADSIYDIDLNSTFRIVTDHEVDHEKIFLMSTKEYDKYLKGSDYDHLDAAWYLRSNTEKWDGQMLIDKYGEYSYTTGRFNFYLRPSMNILPESITFLSPAEGGKENALGLFPVEEKENISSWKLTLTDDSRNFSAATDGIAYSDDRTLTIDYTGAESEPNEYISAFLLDDKDNLLSYGALGRFLPESGALTITLPDDLKNGNYTLKVFSEQRSGDQRSDYISLPQTLSFTLKDRPFVPETGDSANLVLWSALAAISAISMMMLMKRKEA